MRTKTLALSALLGAIGAVSAVAQTNVYSINAVGYINVTLYPGFNLVTCPLICSPDNTVGTLLNNSNGAFQGTGHPLPHALIYQYQNGVGYVNGDSSGNVGGNGWSAGGTNTINPGQSIFFFNPEPLGTGSNMFATFVGTVPQSNNYYMTNALVPGFNLVGSIIPTSGDIITNSISLVSTVPSTRGDAIYTYDPLFNSGTSQQGGYGTEGVATYTPANGWNLGGAGVDPFTTNVYTGFFYYNNSASVTKNWVENFTINP
jgi:hypothetical protein